MENLLKIIIESLKDKNYTLELNVNFESGQWNAYIRGNDKNAIARVPTSYSGHSVNEVIEKLARAIKDKSVVFG